MNEENISYKELQPTHPLLKHYIHSYTYSIGTLYEQDAKHLIRAIPSVMTQLYFEFCGGLSEIEQDAKRMEVTRRSYVNTGLGAWMDIYQLASPKKTRAIKNFKVDLLPHTLYELFHISPNELYKQDISVEDIFGATNYALMFEELDRAKNGEEMIEVFEKYFLTHILSSNTKGLEQYEKFIHPAMNLSELSQEVGYSQRWLQKRYREVMGLSYKQLQGNQRFLKTLHNIHALVASKQVVKLSYLAYEHGYFDQAHFIKEFKRYTGMTPSEYIDKTFHLSTATYWEW